MNTCSTCGKETSNPKFCNRSCSARTTNATHPRRKRTTERDCTRCGAKTRNTMYCSATCHHAAEQEEYIEKWITGEVSGTTTLGFLASPIRRWIKERDGNKCTQCGWAEVHPTLGTVPVQIDHIDGDFTNNRPENLRLLCPNCHSLTPTWMALNRGNGRRLRRFTA